MAHRPQPTAEDVARCSIEQVGQCRLDADCVGWGCRFIRIAPSRLPLAQHERVLLFNNVYNFALKNGILKCKNFVESRIDEVVEDDDELRKISTSGGDIQTVLLSEENQMSF